MKKRKRIPIEQINDSYNTLAKAIVYQAMADYMRCYRAAEARKESTKLYDMNVVREKKEEMNKIEAFLLSDETKYLTDLDGEVLVKGLQKIKMSGSPFLYNSGIIIGGGERNGCVT